MRDPLGLSVVGIYWQGFGNALSLPYTGLSLVKVDLGTVVLPDRQESNEFGSPAITVGQDRCAMAGCEVGSVGVRGTGGS